MTRSVPVLAVSDSTTAWALEWQLKHHHEEVAVVVSDDGELLGLLRRDAVMEAVEQDPGTLLRLLPVEAVDAEPREDERWNVAFTQLEPATARLLPG